MRDEIMQTLRDIAQTERLALLAVSVVYVWLISQALDDHRAVLIDLAWWLPAVIIAIAFKKTEDHILRIRTLADYLQRMQAILADPRIAGWETYVRSHRTITLRNRALDATGRIIWALTLVISVLLAVKFGWRPD
ncbi:hypothetical protein [Sulfitobacter sabulilitoris]|uniref:Uncharacterized protein n=1 Tax=Sulfitobacter sabulilitoris TaxID=2562655 RepID=A0A5S3PDY7_9RHOB|nr:hypothetical protein [Sulfitobacter sabulilitoris]TMM51169.1 hypothetical protein FDT80_15005 [Sulfitobacter sabulilitoris]